MDTENFTGTLPEVPKSGVYNVTIDVKEKMLMVLKEPGR